MGLIINLIAAVILFIIPLKRYSNKALRVAPHPLYKEKLIGINADLDFLIFSILTAMVFLGPLSLVKYAYWIIVLIILCFNRFKLKIDSIILSYMLFIGWALLSALFITDVPFAALMMLIKYTLPLLYLWLAYTAINDSDDFLYFLKITSVGMCVYAMFIGGFAAKFLTPIYSFLNWGSGGLFISYAPLADYFSALIVIPLALFLITEKKIWLYATVWIILSTVLETVRTGLGALCIAASFLFLTIYKIKALPWVAGILMVGIIIIFTVPAFRDKMFVNDDVSIETFSASQANFENISSNGREALWDLNMQKFYDPSPLIGSGLGASGDFMKNREGLHLIHSDYVQILCDLGNIGIILFGIFVLVTLIKIIATSWKNNCPNIVKLTGGMALGSCGATFFSMGFDNVVTYAQQSFVLPFIMIGIFLKANDLYKNNEWR